MTKDIIEGNWEQLKGAVKALLVKANILQDKGVVDVTDKDTFIAAAKTRQWDREKSVRTLA